MKGQGRLWGYDETGRYRGVSRLLEKYVWRNRSAVATVVTDLSDADLLPGWAPSVLGTGNFFMGPRHGWLARVCDWYICRIDYGRPNVWRPMYALYVKANRYVNEIIVAHAVASDE